jgi:hypothetical protein
MTAFWYPSGEPTFRSLSPRLIIPTQNVSVR